MPKSNERAIKVKDEEITLLTNLLKEKDQEINVLKNQLDKVLNTYRWRYISMIIEFFDKFKLLYLFKIIFKKLIQKKTNHSTLIKNNDDQKEKNDTHSFNPYRNIQILKDIEIKVISEDFTKAKVKSNFTIIITVKNEESNIANFLHNIENQSLKPNEVIIVDGGSTDKTIYEIEKFISGTRLNVKFIKGGFPNIPEGRNIGIKNSSFENIVIADAGNIINKDYARNLIGTLSKYKADLVGGIFYPVKHTKYANFFLVDWTKTNWLTFLPSTRALAIKKTLAIKCGLFPEYVNSGDDTLFDINYRKKSKKWVFNKNIVTHWQTATTKNEFEKVVRSYGKADGEDGIGDYLYWELNALNKTELPLNEPVLRKEQFRNYLDGKKNRVNIEIEKRKISGLILVFTVNQLSDYPEDSKIVILIKKYLVNNFKVFFISCSKPAFINNKKIFFDLDLTLLELSYITDFNIEHILNTYNRVIDKTIIIQESKSKMVKEIIRKTISKNKNIKIVRVS